MPGGMRRCSSARSKRRWLASTCGGRAAGARSAPRSYAGGRTGARSSGARQVVALGETEQDVLHRRARSLVRLQKGHGHVLGARRRVLQRRAAQREQLGVPAGPRGVQGGGCEKGAA